jgi:hypothetical protein
VKYALIATSILAGLTLFGTSGFAQDRDRDNDRYYQQNRDEGWWQGHLFQRVREDLDHIQQVTPKLSTDQYRLVVVKKDLDDLQGKMESKTYDKAALDRTITAVERVMNDNTLTARDRTMLGDDLRRLREFREHHDGYR